MVDSIRSSGLQGIQSGLAAAGAAASRISSGREEVDIPSEAVNLKLAEAQVRASSAIIKVADNLDDALLDIVA